MDNIFFSIIIPTHNRASFLSAAIQSVLHQTFQDWECLIVDDGSTDNTREVVNQVMDRRIKYFYKRNEERSVARNFGIDRAKGKYICFLDSDDKYYPTHLEVLYKNIEAENFPTALFSTRMNEYRNGKLIERPIYNEVLYDHPVKFIWEKFMLINSVCVSKEIVNKQNFPPFNVWEDTHLWLRIVAKYPFYQIDEITTQWNFHEHNSVSQAFENVDSEHVRNYLDCISHLFLNYQELLEPFLSKRDMRNYQFKKFKMFLKICKRKKDYKTFINLYLISLNFPWRHRVNKLVFSFIKQKLEKNFAKLQLF